MKQNISWEYIVVAVVIIAGVWLYTTGGLPLYTQVEDTVLPQNGVVLPVRWGNIGKQMVANGVIDEEKFLSLYQNNPNLKSEAAKLLEQSDNGALEINAENSGLILNLLWALGLGEKNDILERGPMVKYGGNAGIFASTGGWTIAKGSAMDHYSAHEFVALTPEQQDLVERVSKNVYRPCCNNPAYFPDCNHGMAMLGLLELLASAGADEKEMYKAALQVNSYWFPDTYAAIKQYLAKNGRSWGKTDPKELLSANFSSASGYQRILSEITPPEQGGGSTCGI